MFDEDNLISLSFWISVRPRAFTQIQLAMSQPIARKNLWNGPYFLRNFRETIDFFPLETLLTSLSELFSTHTNYTRQNGTVH